MNENPDISGVIKELTSLSNNEIKNRIDNYLIWENYGIQFIKKLSANSFLDGLANPQNEKLVFISNYCDKKIKRINRNIDIDKLVKWVLVLGIVPVIYYALEIVKTLLKIFGCCHC